MLKTGVHSIEWHLGCPCSTNPPPKRSGKTTIDLFETIQGKKKNCPRGPTTETRGRPSGKNLQALHFKPQPPGLPVHARALEECTRHDLERWGKIPLSTHTWRGYHLFQWFMVSFWGRAWDEKPEGGGQYWSDELRQASYLGTYTTERAADSSGD